MVADSHPYDAGARPATRGALGRCTRMTIELEPFGGIAVRWTNGITLLVDPAGAWVAGRARDRARVVVGRA